MKRQFKKLLQTTLGLLGFRLVRIYPTSVPHSLDSRRLDWKKHFFVKRTEVTYLTNEEIRQIVNRMDRGNFDFNELTQKKLIKQWHSDNRSVPLPTNISRIFKEEDALKANSMEVMEVTYRLPYGLAYEEAQEAEYLYLIKLCQSYGIEFDGSVVADAGCGYGGLLNVISRLYEPAGMYGIECVSSAIEWISKNRPHIVGIVGDLQTTFSKFENLLGGGGA